MNVTSGLSILDGDREEIQFLLGEKADFYYEEKLSLCEVGYSVILSFHQFSSLP